jgi:hypothetical protein
MTKIHHTKVKGSSLSREKISTSGEFETKSKFSNNSPTTEDYVEYEEEGMDLEKDRVFTQKLINSGQAWQMQGSYGRHAMDMINSGQCMLGKESHTDYYGNRVGSRYDVVKGTKGSEEFLSEDAREQLKKEKL